MNILPASSLASAPHLLPAGASAKALIGVRPEAVRMGAAGVPVSVVAVEFLGADTLIETRLGETPFVVRTPGKAAVTQGQIIHVEWLSSDAHMFDTKAQ